MRMLVLISAPTAHLWRSFLDKLRMSLLKTEMVAMLLASMALEAKVNGTVYIDAA